MRPGMNYKLWNIVALVCVFGIFKVSSNRYDDFKMYRIVAHGPNELLFNKALFEIAEDYDINLFRPAKFYNQTFFFMVPKMYVKEIDNLLAKYGITDQWTQQLQRKDGKSLFDEEIDLSNIPFDEDVIKKKYLNYMESNEYVDLIVSKIKHNNPNIIASTEVIGHSYENRLIRATTLQYKDKKDNPIILIDALIHARERHSGSMALYTLKSLADEATKGVNGILFKATFVIINMVNPDGYEYSLTVEPLWRKTKKPSVLNNGCLGVDGNRNYDVHWHEGELEKIPCGETYRGLEPFSEPETQAVRNIMLSLRDKIKMYISIHTFGNTILYPYGFSTTKHPRGNELHAVALAGAEAVFAATGSVFVPGQSGSQLYVAAGGSDDYADSIGIPFAYTFELGDEKYQRFAVNEQFIEPTIKDGWIVIRAMVEKVLTM
ncbi:unnamed protein product [Diamesa hyperborea]